LKETERDMPTIVRRARLGNSTEDISYMGNGQMAVLDAPLTDADPLTNRAVITTLDASLVGDFNTRKSLGVLAPGDVAEIISGREAGLLSIIDRSSNELVVFSMDAGTV
jgi:hypothetical protein